MDELMDAVTRRVAAARLECRLPSLAVAVGREGKPLAVEVSGLADVPSGLAAGPATQYRLGSITKTFTAAVVLLLAERGTLDLDEPVDAYLPGTPFARVRLRQLLAHGGGVQREAAVPMWSTMRGPDAEELRASLSQAETVDAPGVRWHYSNLGYALLGQIVVEATGASCAQLVEDLLVRPLGLRATTWQPTTMAAAGYRLDPYQDTVHPEPLMDQGAVGVGGQLWSTGEDLVVWGDALTGGAPSVVPPPVVAAMHTVHVMTDLERWSQGWGLGLILERSDLGIRSGHTGAMPGFLAAMAMDRPTRTVVATFTNVTRGIPLAALAADLLTETLRILPPAEPRPARNHRPVPVGLEGVLGRWWCEAEETVFTWHDGTLHAHLADHPTTSGTIFEPDGQDGFRASRGRLCGERLRVERDEHQKVIGIVWATYPFTRNPR